MSIDKDYYKPRTTKGAFNSNYVQYGSMGGWRVKTKTKSLSDKKYLTRIKPCLSDIIINYKTQGTWRIYSCNEKIEHKTQSEWKIQLTMAINFISSKLDSDETRIMHPKSENIEIIMGSETEEVIEELFKSLRQKYQKKKKKRKEKEKSMKGSHFIFDVVNALHHKLNEVSLSRADHI